MLAEVLEHEAPHAGACVERGENEQRLEHDGEVVPQGDRARSAERAGKEMRHAYGETRRTTGARKQGCLTNLLRKSVQLSGGDDEAPLRNGRRCTLCGGPE